MRSEKCFGSGLRENWTDKESGEKVQSCTIVTTDANEVVAPIHNRMPVILGPDQVDTWLDPKGRTDSLAPCPADWLECFPVDPRVGKCGTTTPI